MTVHWRNAQGTEPRKGDLDHVRVDWPKAAWWPGRLRGSPPSREGRRDLRPHVRGVGVDRVVPGEKSCHGDPAPLQLDWVGRDALQQSPEGVQASVPVDRYT